MIDTENSVPSETDKEQSDQKNRREHSYCRYYDEGLCGNRTSLFFRQVRELDDPFCSVFQKRDEEFKS